MLNGTCKRVAVVLYRAAESSEAQRQIDRSESVGGKSARDLGDARRGIESGEAGQLFLFAVFPSLGDLLCYISLATTPTHLA